MEIVFKSLKQFALAFYAGWMWSLKQTYTQGDFEDFNNRVIDPLDREGALLLEKGVDLQEIDAIMNEAKNEVGFGIADSE